MPLLALPNEILVSIAWHLPTEKDIERLARTCRRLHSNANLVLYQRNRLFNDNWALEWAAQENMPATIRHAVGAGASLVDAELGLLHLAATYGHDSLIHILIGEFGMDPDDLDEEESETPLLMAVVDGQYDCAKALLARGANPSMATNEGETPLHAAASQNHPDIAKLLLDAGVDVSPQYSENTEPPCATPLHLATHGGYTDVVKVLLDHSADPNMPGLPGSPCSTPLGHAVAGGHVDTVRVLLERGANPNIGSSIAGMSLLHVAVQNRGEGEEGNESERDVDSDEGRGDAYIDNGLEIVKLLVKAGADLNACSLRGSTPLHLAIELQQAGAAVFLIKSGADVSIANDGRRQPIHLAVLEDLSEVVEALGDAGADMNVAANDALTPLTLAMMGNPKVDIIQALLENGADLKTCGSLATTLVHAARVGDVELMELLISFGADVNIADSTGSSLLHYATKADNIETMKKLLESGVSPLAANKDGDTPLHHAARSGSLEAFKLLTDRGADPCCVNAKGQTPLHVAAKQRNHREFIVQLLSRHQDVGLEMADCNGYTPLLAALETLQLPTAACLIDSGANVNACNSSGAAALRMAVEWGETNVVKHVLESGNTDVNQQDADGRTAVCMAALLGHKQDIMSVLLSHEPRPDSAIKDHYGATPLMMAARNGHARELEQLLGLDDKPLRAVDVFGHDVFYWAARCNNPEVRWLLAPYAPAASQMDIPDGEGRDSRLFKRLACFCGICGRSAVDEATRPGPAQQCNACLLGRHANDAKFVICSHCVGRGVKCRNVLHSWSPHNCDCATAGRRRRWEELKHGATIYRAKDGDDSEDNDEIYLAAWAL